MAHRLRGIVKTVVLAKRFGFITGDVDGVDYFFHHTSIGPTLRFEDLIPGTRVSFLEASGAKGPRAEDIGRG
jgi:cold shock CspA family protein